MSFNLARLTPREWELFEAGYLLGYADRQPDIDRANADADRYYAALHNPRPPVPTGPTFEERERLRHTETVANAVTVITPWPDAPTRIPPGTTITAPSHRTETTDA